ncbi:hypothetical protein K7432_007880 [Basidiobolus ranarum]|uniref:Dentin sialophosphoprotein n=1 Tax=Basidiobolus ranarum TaxID=34480 RepID=A0ABR2VZH3_9FUNG
MKLSSARILFAFSSIVAVQAAVIKRHNGVDHGNSVQTHDSPISKENTTHGDGYNQNMNDTGNNMSTEGISMTYDTSNTYGALDNINPSKPILGDGAGDYYPGGPGIGDKNVGIKGELPNTYGDVAPLKSVGGTEGKQGTNNKKKPRKCRKSKSTKGPDVDNENISHLNTDNAPPNNENISHLNTDNAPPNSSNYDNGIPSSDGSVDGNYEKNHSTDTPGYDQPEEPSHYDDMSDASGNDIDTHEGEIGGSSEPEEENKYDDSIESNDDQFLDAGGDNDYNGGLEHGTSETTSDHDEANEEESNSGGYEEGHEEETSYQDNSGPDKSDFNEDIHSNTNDEYNDDSQADSTKGLQSDSDSYPENSEPSGKNHGDTYEASSNESEKQGSGDDGPNNHIAAMGEHVNGDGCESHDLNPMDKMNHDNYSAPNGDSSTSNLNPNSGLGSGEKGVDPKGGDAVYGKAGKYTPHNTSGLDSGIEGGEVGGDHPAGSEASMQDVYQTADVSGFGSKAKPSSNDYNVY